MKSFMAIRMEEHTIAHILSASQAPPNDMVAVPPGQFSDFLIAERTETALLFPERE